MLPLLLLYQRRWTTGKINLWAWIHINHPTYLLLTQPSLGHTHTFPPNRLSSTITLHDHNHNYLSLCLPSSLTEQTTGVRRDGSFMIWVTYIHKQNWEKDGRIPRWIDISGSAEQSAMEFNLFFSSPFGRKPSVQLTPQNMHISEFVFLSDHRLVVIVIWGCLSDLSGFRGWGRVGKKGIFGDGFS